MPETRLERGVFILGVLAIAALGFLVVHLWHSPRGAAPSPGTATLRTLTRTSPATAPTQSTAPATTASSTTLARTTTSAVTAPATGAVSLLIRARVDTWIEVRSASSTGRVLYSGTLAAASSKTFHARSLWARFGSAGNLAARLDGKPVPLPSGTYDATFDAGHGFRPQRG